MSTDTEKLKPHEKMPEHHSTDKTPTTKEEKIDAQMEDSFPASDPPSFSGGNHIIGAPSGRESESPSGDAHDVVEAEKKVKDGSAKTPKTY
ncbi:MAG: hypothetical protein H0U98_09225 [Alphaproteobacteria bacterium]|nr:hypothetical protein [Alphaproteobacteria bacterium]